ncbi:unnamed protein product [Meloidogyne enterolobii]|uniref:Uncharacterized protein n=1 Tax=Meloidogyne enterolobii TaxID=390850 RepID=A0ACB0XK80_MELEN
MISLNSKKGLIFFLFFSLICIEYAIGMRGAGGSRRGRRREAEKGENPGGDKKRSKAGGAGSSKGTEKHLGDKGAGGSGGGKLPSDPTDATECELVMDEILRNYRYLA